MSHTDLPSAVAIPLHKLDTLAILRQSIVRHDAMKRTPAAYRRSNLDMQDVGLLGEHAVAYWLRRHSWPVALIGDDETHRKRWDGDVAVDLSPDADPWGAPKRHLTFEVKTNRVGDWRRYERTLDAAQLRRSAAHAYIWCTVPTAEPRDIVHVMGWLPTADIRSRDAGHGTWEHSRSHWRVTTPMRDMQQLPAWIDRQAH